MTLGSAMTLAAAPEKPVPGVPRPQGPGTAGRARLQQGGLCGRPQAGLVSSHQAVSGQHTLPLRMERDEVAKHVWGAWGRAHVGMGRAGDPPLLGVEISGPSASRVSPVPAPSGPTAARYSSPLAKASMGLG